MAGEAWFDRNTHHWDDWPLDLLFEAKAGRAVSLVVPARNEAATVGDVVSRVREALVDTVALLDEIVVIDSDSTDETYDVATDAGAVVHRAAEIRADLGTVPGKGEAMWKSQFVTKGEVIVFMDADLLDWDTHFVPGLLGPLLTRPEVQLVKGFYERPLVVGETVVPFEGGRVTELVARPLIRLLFPELGGLHQPLAGEWAVRQVAVRDAQRPDRVRRRARRTRRHGACARARRAGAGRPRHPRTPAPEPARPERDVHPDPRGGAGPRRRTDARRGRARAPPGGEPSVTLQARPLRLRRRCDADDGDRQPDP